MLLTPSGLGELSSDATGSKRSVARTICHGCAAALPTISRRRHKQVAAELAQHTGQGHLLRLQILGVLLCALLPYVGYNLLSVNDSSALILLTSTVGSLLASAGGLFFLRNLNTYPGVEGSAYIIPSFCLTFGIVLALIFLSRVGYSRSLFISSFLLDIVFFYAVYFTVQRRFRFTVGIVPGGDAVRMLEVDQVLWVHLRSPDDPLPALSAVAVDLRADLGEAWDRRLADFALAGLPVYHSKHLRESLTGRVELAHLSENSFGSLSPVSAYMTMKHGVDWIVALVALVVLSPLLLLVAMAIRFDSAGGPLFRQRRVGYRGEPFVVWKFRTMVAVNPAERGDERTAAMTGSDDRRITRLGRFLRKSRIDELPQLINVLKGEMSWIGPRPEAEVLSQWYETEIPFYRYRHIVRPGITGWAQVSQGHVAEVEDVRNKLYYDFYYIKNFSPWIDFLICARTIRTMLTGFGAR